jgi:hypothetical protein
MSKPIGFLCLRVKTGWGITTEEVVVQLN